MRPVREPGVIASGHAAAVTNRVVPWGPPRMQAKQPSSHVIGFVCTLSLSKGASQGAPN
jgi:hypothetical protein